MQKISSNLRFDNEAEAAANFYTGIFKNSRIGRISRYSNEGIEIHGRPAGSVMTVEFFLEDHQFIALNGGPVFKFNEAVSFIINCDNQEEVDYYWDKLSEGGEIQMCGWLKDKFGLSWQVVPTMVADLFTDHESANAQRAMQALMQMKKLDIAALEKAYAG